MRKNLALWIEDSDGKFAVWETPLGPFANKMSNDEILTSLQDVLWGELFPEPEIEGWRKFRMEIREY